MKILLKNKVDKKLNILYKRRYELSKINRIDYHELGAIFFIVLLVGFLIYVMLFIENSNYTLHAGFLWFSTYSLVFTPLFTASRRIKNLKIKINKEISKLEKIEPTLKYADNYKIYYKEMLELQKNYNLDKLCPYTVQAVIEEYRRQAVPKNELISNSERLSHFTENELNEINNLVQIEND